jgi:hypothetical protein
MSGKTPARDGWEAEMARSRLDVDRDPAANTIRVLAEQVFAEYDQALFEAERRAGEMEDRYAEVTLALRDRTADLEKILAEHAQEAAQALPRENPQADPQDGHRGLWPPLDAPGRYRAACSCGDSATGPAQNVRAWGSSHDDSPLRRHVVSIADGGRPVG